MTAQRDPERLIRRFLDEGQVELSEAAYDAVRHEIDHTNQRVFIGPWRTPFMNGTTLRYGIAAVAVIVLAFAGWRFLPGGNVAAPPEPTPSPIPGPSATALTSDDAGTALEGGRYSFEIGEGERHRTVELTIPATWVAPVIGTNQTAFQPTTSDYFPYIGFFSVQRVYADPCHPETGVAGTHSDASTADELVEELGSLPGFTIGSVSTRSVGDLTASHLTISNVLDPEERGCTDGVWLPLFITWDGTVSSELSRRSEEGSPRTIGGTRQELWIVSRGGDDPNPLLIVTETGTMENPGTPADREMVEQILSTVRFR